jgi:hypothetical protein
MIMLTKTNELTDAPLDWAVAKCEGHNVVVLTVEEQEARWFKLVDPDQLERERAAFDMCIKGTLRPEVRVVEDGGYKRHPTHSEAPMVYGRGIPRFEYSSNWAQGGPIIEREGICLKKGHSGWWIAKLLDVNDEEHFVTVAPTPLVAAMRCYVASKLGNEVDIPKELL